MVYEPKFVPAKMQFEHKQATEYLVEKKMVQGLQVMLKTPVYKLGWT